MAIIDRLIAQRAASYGYSSYYSNSLVSKKHERGLVTLPKRMIENLDLLLRNGRP